MAKTRKKNTTTRRKKRTGKKKRVMVKLPSDQARKARMYLKEIRKWGEEAKKRSKRKR
jgi:hypothetical protein